MTNWVLVPLPRNLMNTVDGMIQKNTKLGYRNKTDFVVTLIRREIQQMEKDEGKTYDGEK